jgi:hypothetical protein
MTNDESSSFLLALFRSASLFLFSSCPLFSPSSSLLCFEILARLPISRAVNQSTKQSINRTVNQPNSQSTEQSINRAVNQPSSQSTEQSINQSTSHNSSGRGPPWKPISEQTDINMNAPLNATYHYTLTQLEATSRPSDGAIARWSTHRPGQSIQSFNP